MLEVLLASHCQPTREKLTGAEIRTALVYLMGWELDMARQCLVKTLYLQDYAQTVRWVNRLAALASEQDHHPEICFGYNQCTVRYQTHSAGGISRNDLICAAKINQMQVA